MIKKLTTSFLLALTATTCFAQQNKIPFEAYNVAEGLPEGEGTNFIIKLLI